MKDAQSISGETSTGSPTWYTKLQALEQLALERDDLVELFDDYDDDGETFDQTSARLLSELETTKPTEDLKMRLGSMLTDLRSILVEQSDISLATDEVQSVFAEVNEQFSNAAPAPRESLDVQIAELWRLGQTSHIKRFIQAPEKEPDIFHQWTKHPTRLVATVIKQLRRLEANEAGEIDQARLRKRVMYQHETETSTGLDTIQSLLEACPDHPTDDKQFQWLATLKDYLSEEGLDKKYNHPALIMLFESLEHFLNSQQHASQTKLLKTAIAARFRALFPLPQNQGDLFHKTLHNMLNGDALKFGDWLRKQNHPGQFSRL